jgi:hypothetical protein
VTVAYKAVRLVVLLLATATSALSADVYECVDANGNLRFTNRWDDSTAGCKRFTLPAASTTTAKVQPNGIIPAEALNTATHALVDPDESVRERAQQDLEKELSYGVTQP